MDIPGHASKEGEAMTKCRSIRIENVRERGGRTADTPDNVERTEKAISTWTEQSVMVLVA